MRLTPARLGRLAATASLAPIAAALMASPAVAEEPATKLALLAPAEVWIDARTATTATVCARGYVDDGTTIVGRWLFHVIGTTTLFNDDEAGATYAKHCFTVDTAGSTAGTAEASLAFAGVGGDVTAECTLTLIWGPGIPINGLLGVCTGIPTPAPTI